MARIAVLGSHPATRGQAPFDDPSWEIWACSPHNAPPHFTLPRVNRWYEVHIPASDPTRDEQYLDYIRGLSKTTPLYMRDRSGHPDALEYPETEIINRFGPFFLRTSSIAFILAHAITYIEENRSDQDIIGLFGIMQASPSEYTYQRPGIQYYIQRALEAGIDVVIPEEAKLFNVTEHKF